MKKGFRLLTLSVSLILCLSAVIFGQRTTGDIQGTVKDAQGALVPGVSVTITGINVGFNRTTQSDDSGIFRVQQIPAGMYKITTAAIKGFAATTTENVSVSIEQSTGVDITLGVTSVNTVDVTSDPLGVNVDTSESKVQTNITAELIDQLPKGTSFQSLLKIAPGVRPEPLSGGYQVDGASGSENSFVVDGQALENFRTGVLNSNNNIPTSLVQEVQVKTSGFEAEHGGASGGVISVQTKGGSDQWRGEFGTQFDISELQAGNHFTPAVFQSVGTAPQFVYGIKSPKDSYVNSYPTASLGGPIVKGRVWFYGNYSPQIFPLRRTTTFYNSLATSSFSSATPNNAGAGLTSNVNLVTSSLYPEATYNNRVTNEYAFGRIDASVFNNLRVSSTYLWNPRITDGNIPYGTISVGGTPNNARVYSGSTYTDTGFQSIGGGRVNSNNFTTQVVYTPTSKMVATFRYGRAFLNEKAGNYAIPTGTRYACSTLVVAGYTGVEGCTPGFDSGVNAQVVKDVSLKNEYNADLTYSVGSFGGRHEIKGGFQYGRTKNDVQGSSVNDPVFGQVTLRYGANFDTYIDSSYNKFCNLKSATNPTGTCLGIGRLYRFGTSGIASNRYIGLYIQDKWQPTSRLTLNIGVRDEKENLPAFNTGGNTGGVPLEFGFGKKIAPRLGGAYDLFGDGKTKIFASYGLFYDRLKFALPRGSFGGDFYRLDYFPILASSPVYSSYTVAKILGTFTDPIGGGDPSKSGGLSVFQQDQRIPSNITEAQAKALLLPFSGIDDNLKPFRQSEVSVGMERELSRIFVLSARYTRKNVDSATEDVGILGAGGSENYIIGNPGEGKALALGQAAGYSKSLKPQRLYKGFEIVLNKRLSNHYFFNMNYTLSRLQGNYSGLASSDEAGRTDPGVSRYFDYIVNGFTFTGQPDNGDLATDRRHAFKAYGGYNFDWFDSKTNTTEFSFFQQVLQGTPQTTYMGINQSSIVFTKRGDLGRTPMFSQTDLSLSHTYRFGRDSRFKVAFDVNVTNAFNQNTVTSYNTTKYAKNNIIAFSDVDPTYTNSPVKALNSILAGTYTPAMADAALALKTGGNPLNVLYGKASGYQAQRAVRFGFRFFF